MDIDTKKKALFYNTLSFIRFPFPIYQWFEHLRCVPFLPVALLHEVFYSLTLFACFAIICILKHVSNCVDRKWRNYPDEGMPGV